MRTNKISNVQVSNGQESVERATISNEKAKDGRFHREERNHRNDVLDGWKRIMMNSPITLAMIVFIISCAAEIMVSWEMYRELLSSISENPHWGLSLLIGLFIVGFAAVVSHFLSKAMSKSLRDWEVYNVRKFAETDMPQARAEEMVAADTRKDFIVGGIGLVLLLSIVALISWQRVFMQSELNEADYSFFHKILPVVIVLVEVISGIYLVFVWTRFIWKKKSASQHKKFAAEKAACAYNTQLAVDLYNKASELGERVSYNKELRDAVYRFENRSSDNDQYVDEIPPAKMLKVIVMSDGVLMAGIHVFGILANGECTNSIYSDSNGQAILLWEGDGGEIKSLYANKEEHPGPFRASSTISIDLNNPGFRMLKAS